MSTYNLRTRRNVVRLETCDRANGTKSQNQKDTVNFLNFVNIYATKIHFTKYLIFNFLYFNLFLLLLLLLTS